MLIIYIGNGKGKTSAAIGLAVRAAGAHLKVLFAQFVKAARATDSGEWPLSSEIGVLKKTPNITVAVLGKGFVGILGDKKTRAEHIQAAESGLRWLRGQIKNGGYDVVVADELISAIELKLFSVVEVQRFVAFANPRLQALALTGHKKFPGLVKDADLVTEMKMIKHPYYRGILAKKGIDY